jgi:hypothetical protein
MTEGDALLAVGKAQGALLELTKELLEEDKHDGLRAATWTSKHEDIFRELADEMRSYGLIDEDELTAAKRAAGEKE